MDKLVVARCDAASRGLALWMALAALSACGGETKPAAAVDKLCSADEQTCFQNALLTCESDGKAWKVAGCGESKACGGGSAGVGCQSLTCARGSLSCDDKKVLKCPDDGLSEPTPVKSCKSAEHCMFGACVPTACTSGNKRCGWNAALSCEGGAWKSSKCASDQRCDDATGACVARVCTPTAIACVNETKRKTCGLQGEGWVEVACAAGQVCSDGVCHAKVKGAGVADAGSDSQGTADAGGGDDGGGGFLDVKKDEFVFEPLDSMTLYKSAKEPIPSGATPLHFEFVAATYLAGEQMLQISGDKNLDKLEIAIAPIEEFTTGSFSDLGGEAPNSGIFMNDGTHDQSKVQWRYQSLEYSISITEFGDVGGRIKGTFKATLGDAIEKGKTLYVEGEFDTKRTQ